jgi:hypothetical protein
MNLNFDVRFLLLLGAGVVAAAWAFANAGPIDELTKTGTNGYVSMVRGLEPPQGAGGIAGGSGNFSPAATTGYGGAPSYYPGA